MTNRKTPTPAEVAHCARRFRWIRTDTVSLVRNLTDAKLKAKPKPIGRPIREIFPHVLESSRFYIRNVLGPVPDLDAVAAQMRMGAMRGADALAAAVEPTVERLASMRAEERKREIRHGAALWTARKMLRRLLEHEWEHHEEIARRLGG